MKRPADWPTEDEIAAIEERQRLLTVCAKWILALMDVEDFERYLLVAGVNHESQNNRGHL